MAGKQFGLWVAGTMAHLLMMFYGPEREIDAFRAYSRAFPKSSVLLIDTYDPIEGARKALQVAKEMRDGTLIKEKQPDGTMKGVSHELMVYVWILMISMFSFPVSKTIREMFDAAGFSNLKIVASGDLDEYKITELLARRCQNRFVRSRYKPRHGRGPGVDGTRD